MNTIKYLVCKYLEKNIDETEKKIEKGEIVEINFLSSGLKIDVLKAQKRALESALKAIEENW